jgi:predicted RND superfamily exporter protein
MWAAFQRLVLRRPGVVVLAAVLSAVPMTWWSVQLFGDLRSDLRELLPEGARSVQTLRELERRFGGFSQLSIIVRSPDRAANRRFSDDLVAALGSVEGIRSARNKLGEEKAFFESRWPLFVSLPDLQLIEERLEDAIHEAKARANPLLVDVESDGDPGPVTLELDDVLAKYEKEKALASRFPDDYFEAQDGSMIAVIVRRRGLAFGLEDSKRLLAAVEQRVAELQPARYHAALEVGLGGDVKNILEVHESLVEDLVTATAIVTVLLLVVVVGYYRRWRATLLIGVPLLIGTAWTFGISHFAIGYLNSSSAFLAAIVPGNGINFGLIMLARYLEERRRDLPTDLAMEQAVRHTWRATSTAALAASVAYGSLVATDFLGFKHFGIIGGIGMVVCWLSTFLVLPALVLWTERWRPMALESELRLPLPAPGSLSARPAAWVTRHPRSLATAGVVTALVAGGVAVAFLDDPFEKDFHKLRNTDAMAEGSAGYWESKVDEIFDRYLNPQVIVAERVEDVPDVVRVLQKVIDEGGARSPIVEVTAMSTLVPTEQAAKLEVIDRIRGLISEDLIAQLDEDQAALARKYRPPEGLTAFAAADLPESIRADFRELDGTEGRVVLVLPNLALNLYHADEIERVAEVMRAVRLPDGRLVESSGNFVIYSDMLSAVGHDGPRATLYSFGGVVLLCLIVFRRPRRVAIVVGSLLAGVAWMGAGLALWDLKINFLNFIGLPITFGIGVDYAVNVFARGLIEDREHAPGEAARRAVTATGGAVVLCSLTTIIGYGSLLVARNGALVSFGKVAILGEITCLIGAMLVMPAWMMLWPDSGVRAAASPARS